MLVGFLFMSDSVLASLPTRDNPMDWDRCKTSISARLFVVRIAV